MRLGGGKPTRQMQLATSRQITSLACNGFGIGMMSKRDVLKKLAPLLVFEIK